MLVIAALGVGGGLYWSAINPAPRPTPTPASQPPKTDRSGVKPWTELERGDCIALLDNAWQDTYTLVNLSLIHI